MRTLALISLLALLTACGESESAPKNDAGGDACVGQAEGTPCGVDMICLSEVCRSSVCGDGYVDAARGEECDDANTITGDGCESSCFFSCHEDADCSDGNACTGFESCVEVAGLFRCQDGLAPNCEPTGEVNPCADYLCLPDAIDLESACHEEVAVVCYADADGDGFLDPETSEPTTGAQCDCPPDYARAPQNGVWDCNDAAAPVKPGSTAFTDTPFCADGQLAVRSEKPVDCPKTAPEKTECYAFECKDGSKPSFDTNCNEKEQPEWIEIYSECESYKDECIGGGWYSPGGTIPPCGATAYSISCTVGEKGDCVAGEAQRTQRCR